MTTRDYNTEPIGSLREHVAYLRDAVQEDPDLSVDLTAAEEALAFRDGPEDEPQTRRFLFRISFAFNSDPTRVLTDEVRADSYAEAAFKSGVRRGRKDVTFVEAVRLA